MKFFAYFLLLAACGIFTPLMVEAEEPVVATEKTDAEAQNADDFLREQGASAESPKVEATKEETPVAAKPQESPDMIAKKAELATKMHQIRPTRVQVDSAIEQAAMNMPEAERQPFIAAMKSVLNYNAIEKISVDAMVDTFTLPELEAMVAYHSTPEAQSVSQKMSTWAMKVQPEVVRMIDTAIMRVKTGAEK